MSTPKERACVPNSASSTRDWKVENHPQIGPGQWRPVPRTLVNRQCARFRRLFPVLGRLLRGVLLCDFSENIDSLSLCFVPFPGGKEYRGKVRVERYFPERFRSVSISQGKICFVHIDNDFHDRVPGRCRRCLEVRDRKRQGLQQQTPKKITSWTLNSEFEWKLHRVINLDSLWAQDGYRDLHIYQRLPEFPTISLDDPNVLCCLLTEEEFDGDGWNIMVGENAHLLSCESLGVEHRRNRIPATPLLPSVFCKYLERPTGN